jgi:hypothetical protein
MKANRFWIEIITLCAGVAFGLALAIVGAVVASGQTPEPALLEAPPSAPQQAYVGMVTCSRCLAKHSPKIGATATDCVRERGPLQRDLLVAAVKTLSGFL